jgi:DHA1 family tetracycline resistance protein-like MFS transporter
MQVGIPIRRGTVAFIFVTVTLDMLALGVVVPVLPKLVLSFEGGDSASAALVYGAFGTIFAAMQFLFAPFLGALSDRFGRRPVILLSNFALGLDYVVMALAPSVPWLFVGRVLSGICSASFSVPMAYIADVTPPERRAAAFGMMSAAFGFGFVLGPAFGGLLGDLDPRLPFWAAAGLSLANALYGVFVLPESLPRERRAPFAWRVASPVGAFGLLRSHPVLLGLAGATFLSSVAHEVNPSTWVLYTDFRYRWDLGTVGLALAALGVTSVLVGAVLVGPVVRGLGERWSLLLGLAFGATGFAVSGLAATGAIFAAAIPLNALWGIAGPASQAIVTSHVDPTEQGRLQGALTGLQGIAHMIGPALFTGVFAAAIRGHVPGDASAGHSAGSPFLLAACLLVASGGLAAAVTRARTPSA